VGRDNLGSEKAGLFSNNDTLSKRIHEAGEMVADHYEAK
jgi:leucyl aminopeptidase